MDEGDLGQGGSAAGETATDALGRLAELPNADGHEVILIVEDEPAVRQFGIDG